MSDNYTIDFRTFEPTSERDVFTPVTFSVREVLNSWEDNYQFNKCSLCNTVIGREGNRYYITSDNVLFPTVIAHEDCVDNYNKGKGIKYKDIVEDLIHSYTKAKEYRHKYEHWYTDRAIIM